MPELLDTVIVGGGIFGITIAKTLKKQGREPLIIDYNSPMAGSPPSGGHMKPSWMAGMGKALYDPALTLLDEIYDLEEEEFKVWPLGNRTKVFRVDTDKALASYPKLLATVTKLELLETNAPQITYYESKVKHVVRTRLLIVAAGVWCQQLLPNFFPEKSLQRKQGVSFRFQGKIEAFIKPWAPYKQIVAHNVGPNEIWAGDGTAILEDNWEEHHFITCKNRCRTALGKNYAEPVRRLTGLRPYHKASPCLLKKIGQRAWVATGAGKLGTIAAGWAALQLVQATN